MFALNKSNIKVYQQGALWSEVLATEEDLNILNFNKIWYEVL